MGQQISLEHKLSTDHFVDSLIWSIRGSIVGTRLDLQESLEMAAEGKVKATVAAEPLENINDILERMRQGKIEGRIVIDYSM